MFFFISGYLITLRLDRSTNGKEASFSHYLGWAGAEPVAGPLRAASGCRLWSGDFLPRGREDARSLVAAFFYSTKCTHRTAVVVLDQLAGPRCSNTCGRSPGEEPFYRCGRSRSRLLKVFGRHATDRTVVLSGCGVSVEMMVVCTRPDQPLTSLLRHDTPLGLLIGGDLAMFCGRARWREARPPRRTDLTSSAWSASSASSSRSHIADRDAFYRGGS